MEDQQKSEPTRSEQWHRKKEGKKSRTKWMGGGSESQEKELENKLQLGQEVEWKN